MGISIKNCDAALVRGVLQDNLVLSTGLIINTYWVRLSFCSSSEAVNASGEAVGGLALTPLARSQIPPATQANCYQYTFSTVTSIPFQTSSCTRRLVTLCIPGPMLRQLTKS